MNGNTRFGVRKSPETEGGRLRWRTEGNKVWTWETADPELYAASVIDAVRIMLLLNRMEHPLVTPAPQEAPAMPKCGMPVDGGLCARDYYHTGDCAKDDSPEKIKSP